MPLIKRIVGFILLAAVGFAGGHFIRVMFSHEQPKPASQSPNQSSNQSPVSDHN
jgi:hypothetical protein